MDAELRAAERSGELWRVIQARKRAGRCPGCGVVEHTGPGTIVLSQSAEGMHPAAHADRRWAEATGEWYVDAEEHLDGTWRISRIVDPCGRALAVLWENYGIGTTPGDHNLTGYEVSDACMAEHAAWWARYENGVLGWTCQYCSDRPADVPSPEWHQVMYRNMPGGGPQVLCKPCLAEIGEHRLEQLAAFEGEHEFEVEDFYDEVERDDDPV